MNIKKLPDLVLFKVFRLIWNNDDSVYSKHYMLDIWKAKLAVSAVCVKWRKLALPYVHKTSFVGCIYPSNRKRGNFSKGIYDSDIESPEEVSSSDEHESEKLGKYALKSNLDIISRKRPSYKYLLPMNIQIFIATSINPVHSLRTTVRKIRKHKVLMKSVHKLEIIIRTYGFNALTRKESSISEAESLGKQLAHLIPNVQIIEWREGMCMPVVHGFAKTLIKDYAHQLTRLSYPQIALEYVSEFSEKLRIIKLYCYDYYGYSTAFMPNVCAENLTVLDLESINGELQWGSFESSGDSECLHFTNLRRLQLRFEPDNNQRYFEGRFVYKIAAPNLDTIRVQLCPFSLLVLTMICGLEIINNLVLEMDDALVSFTKLNLSKARNLFVQYARGGQEEYKGENIYNYINNMFNINGLAEYSNVKIWREESPLDIEHINWRYATDVSIFGFVNIENLEKLVYMLPSVECMYIDEIRVRGLKEKKLVEPIQSNMHYLKFSNGYGYSKTELYELKIYLDKAFPSSQINIV